MGVIVGYGVFAIGVISTTYGVWYRINSFNVSRPR